MRGRKIEADARMGVGWELTRGRGEVRGYLTRGRANSSCVRADAWTGSGGRLTHT